MPHTVSQNNLFSIRKLCIQEHTMNTTYQLRSNNDNFNLYVNQKKAETISRYLLQYMLFCCLRELLYGQQQHLHLQHMSGMHLMLYKCNTVHLVVMTGKNIWVSFDTMVQPIVWYGAEVWCYECNYCASFQKCRNQSLGIDHIENKFIAVR